MSDEREIQQVMAKYVRATDARDGNALKALFTKDAKVQIFYNNPKPAELIGELSGQDTIGSAVANMMKPHPARGWSHHTTFDLIIEVNGNQAKLSAQFIAYNIVGSAKPAGGWPKGASGAQGSIMPIESGYYEPSFEKVADVWKITHLRILHDLPMAF